MNTRTMFTRHAPVLCGLACVLVACADSATNRTITAPDVESTLDVAAAPANITVTDLATGEELMVAARVGTDQAATGGRATGHADITSGSTGQKYSFSALSTGDFPNAKGQSEGHVIDPTFGRAIVHVDVDCLAITGNNAWVSGPVTKFRINGQDVPFPPGLQALARVQDNGEGGTTVDEASLGVGVFGAQVCRSRPLLPLLPSDHGNIQVSQR
jgi:hypothetical protein